MLKTLAIAAGVLLFAGSAQAHFVWIERDGAGEARAYFGEWADDVREKAGGHLDLIKTPQAFQADRARKLAVVRAADHLAIAAEGAGDVRLVEEGLAPREDKRAGGRTKAVFHAKAGRADTRGALDLELVPAAANGNDFVLQLRGAPLARAEVKVFGPPRWEKTYRTDEAGRVRIDTPWAGRYVVEVVHTEERAGGSGEEAYNRIRHVSTLSFVAEQGIPWAGK